MDIKVLDFRYYWNAKERLCFGQQGKDATNAVKGVLMFSKGYSLIMQWSCHINNCRWYRNNFGNLKDIDMMTSQYAIDSDELFDNLNIIADKIKTGDD
jgi:hypothetical protein